MKRVMAMLVVLMVFLVLALGTMSTVRAANPPATGQPNQSCQAQPSSPGHASSSSGSAFNADGKAASVYAGAQPQNSKNPASVAQYDVACFQVSSNGGH